jgi:hypothetical protein
VEVTIAQVDIPDRVLFTAVRDITAHRRVASSGASAETERIGGSAGDRARMMTLCGRSMLLARRSVRKTLGRWRAWPSATGSGSVGSGTRWDDNLLAWRRPESPPARAPDTPSFPWTIHGDAAVIRSGTRACRGPEETTGPAA